MKTLLLARLLIFVVIFTALTHMGCVFSPIGDVAQLATLQQNDISEMILIKNKPANIMEIAANVGESMGYTVKNGNPAASQDIQLESKTSPAAYLITSHAKNTTIKVMNHPDGLDIHLRIWGTFGSGSREDAQKIMEEYKEKLLTKLPQR
jgi:hypothetical protein